MEKAGSEIQVRIGEVGLCLVQLSFYCTITVYGANTNFKQESGVKSAEE